VGAEEVDVPHCRIIRGDAQAAFTSHSPEIEFLYQSNGIVFEPVRRMEVPQQREGKKGKSEPYHNSLGIIDRLTRTIRDMLYNINISDPVFPIIDSIVAQYNQAPHDTLTHYGPGFPVSPIICHQDRELRDYIKRRICQENALTIHRQGFAIPIGDIVALYNPANIFDKRRSRVIREVFRVVDFKNGTYEIKGIDSGKVLHVPRSQLKPAPVVSELGG
jgi:hypothetical protein